MCKRKQKYLVITYLIYRVIITIGLQAIEDLVVKLSKICECCSSSTESNLFITNYLYTFIDLNSFVLLL